MKTIIVAVDFSEGSSNALIQAKKIAKATQQKLCIVHAYSPPILDPNIPVGMIEETFKVTIDVLEEKLKKERDNAIAEGIQTEYKLAFSDLSSMINDISTDCEVSMAVVGKTGKSTFIDNLIGSTASHLVDHLDIPLMVIPENFEGEIFSKICYATQLEYDEEKFIENAIKLAQNSPQGLEIVHIRESDELDIYPNEQFLKSIKENFDNEKIQMLHKASKTFTSGINELTVEEKITLLILTTHKRGLLSGLLNPSKTKKILKHTKIPILIYSFE